MNVEQPNYVNENKPQSTPVARGAWSNKGPGRHRGLVVAFVCVVVILGGPLVYYAPGLLLDLFGRNSRVRALVRDVRTKLTPEDASTRLRPEIREKIAIWNLETDRPFEDGANGQFGNRLASKAEEVGTLVCITNVRSIPAMKYDSGKIGYRLFATVYIVQYPENTVAGPFLVKGEMPHAFVITKSNEAIEGDLKKPLMKWIFKSNQAFQAAAHESGMLFQGVTKPHYNTLEIRRKVAVWDIEKEAPFKPGLMLSEFI